MRITPVTNSRDGKKLHEKKPKIAQKIAPKIVKIANKIANKLY
jgi:hypothetical protein